MPEYLQISPNELPFSNWTRRQMFVRYVLTCCTMIILMRLWYYVLGASDPLATPIVHGDILSIDYWSFVHISFYIGVGFVLPDYFLIGLLGGIIFEAFEAYAASVPLLDVAEFWEERGLNSLWDVIFNSVGFRIGQILLVLYVQRNRNRKPEKHAPSQSKKKKKK